MTEEQLAAAEFVLDLAKGLGYVDKQTTNRPSQQPPALRTSVKEFVSNIVKQVGETNTTPNITHNPLPSTQPPASVPVPVPAPAETIQQLEMSFKEPTAADIMIKYLKNIDITLTKILEKLNETNTEIFAETPTKKKNRTTRTKGCRIVEGVV